jgi:hypothetical protein
MKKFIIWLLNKWGFVGISEEESWRYEHEE